MRFAKLVPILVVIIVSGLTASVSAQPSPYFQTAATAQDTTYHGPPYGPGTAIPNKPVTGGTTIGPNGSFPPPGFFPGGMTFAEPDRGTIGGYFRTYWLCPACGYTGNYVPYQVGGYIGGGTFAPFPPQLLGQLPPAPQGTIYVFANQNALLVAQGSGQILDVIPLYP